jgi:hypothetical protein
MRGSGAIRALGLPAELPLFALWMSRRPAIAQRPLENLLQDSGGSDGDPQSRRIGGIGFVVGYCRNNSPDSAIGGTAALVESRPSSSADSWIAPAQQPPSRP